MIPHHRLITITLCMLVAVFAHGQHSLRQNSLRQPPPGQSPLGQSPLRFEHLSTAQGLSSNTIFSIYQDRDGFMWFGTGDGLNRYDGYTFTVYKPDPADPNNHMAHNNIWDMLESRSGEIWFVTPGGGLHRLDKRTGRVNFFRVERAGSGQVAAYDICYTLIEDRQGYLWIGSEGGLARFNPRTKQYRLYSVPVARGADGRVWSIQEDRFGTLWVGTATGLFTMNRQTGKFSPFYFGPDPAKPQPRIESMYLAADNSLWLAAFNDGLYQLRPGKKPSPGRDEALTTYAPTGRKYLPNREIMPKGLGENEHHDLMVGTLSGLVQLDPASGKTITYRPNPSIPGSLSHEVVWALLADRRGSFWIGSANGIDHYSTLTPRFEFYQPIPDHNATPRVENNITMLSADRRGRSGSTTPPMTTSGRYPA
ncbi:ligand-binding sensor domain-containing protein [Spirosoma rhododendri]|uniref:Histidine kinase n=1 Tax=Spirosoma rhododendri TaxID=2728024 RepID=A0A7L5DLZ0_9BACT|nr:two-component regulator propeller domain-containing protein [Spirosoma rhododendri]QJD79489.1 hypothetical protein HH216_14550 [Spirosoma rhododendri]